MSAPPRPDLHARFPGTAPELLDELGRLVDEYGPAGVAVTLDQMHPGIFPLGRRLASRRNRTPDRNRGALEWLGRAIGIAILVSLAAATVALARITIGWALS